MENMIKYNGEEIYLLKPMDQALLQLSLIMGVEKNADVIAEKYIDMEFKQSRSGLFGEDDKKWKKICEVVDVGQRLEKYLEPIEHEMVVRLIEDEDGLYYLQTLWNGKYHVEDEVVKQICNPIDKWCDLKVTMDCNSKITDIRFICYRNDLYDEEE